MSFLLDINVLIALIDPAHVAHEAAHTWFETEGHEAWATCPLTENGVVRIVGHPRYPNSPGAPAAVAKIMRDFANCQDIVSGPTTSACWTRRSSTRNACGPRPK